MISALDTYLGWDQPQHLPGCKRPAWDVGIRTEEREYRHRSYGDPPLKHNCPDECCEHGNSFDATIVRIVCTSCGAARVITGERTQDTRDTETSTQDLGYGLPPRTAAGLLLWPGQPWLLYNLRESGERHDFVVTRPKAKHVAEEAIIGQITQGRGERGGVVWTALAVPDPDGPYGFGQRLRWRYANDGRGRGGSPLRSVPAAARWINERLAEAQGGTA
ncbi:hypothetical protein ACIQMP_07840 [Streptomyces sp. NPDC091385]|uniref:hypothetical protein n=1 Tax=Streptomyces sp. NPDC091385 TaxID=3365997 RepID=UPI0038215565